MPAVEVVCQQGSQQEWRASTRIGRLTSCEARASQVADEEGKADTDRSNERGVVFLNSEHEDGEHQERSQKHLNEETLSKICACGQRRCYREFLSTRMRLVIHLYLKSKIKEETYFWKEDFDNACSGNGSNNLSDEDHSGACVCQAADERQS
jgi:hypothetical protein